MKAFKKYMLLIIALFTLSLFGTTQGSRVVAGFGLDKKDKISFVKCQVVGMDKKMVTVLTAKKSDCKNIGGKLAHHAK